MIRMRENTYEMSGEFLLLMEKLFGAGIIGY